VVFEFSSGIIVGNNNIAAFLFFCLTLFLGKKQLGSQAVGASSF
jgi:hypothetical protein